MKRVWHVAVNDLRLMVRDKVFFFWTLVFPMFFILMFGLLFKSGNPDKAGLTVVNMDRGRWGAYFIEKLKTPAIELTVTDKEPAEYNRLLVIPTDFSRHIEEWKDQPLLFKKQSGSNDKAAARVQTRIIQAIARVMTELILYGDRDLKTFLDHPPEFRNLVTVKSRFPGNTITVVPSGFDHVIPGVTIQFVMMMVLIYGGITVMEDRKKGMLGRMLFSPLSTRELFLAKLTGRWLMGLLQAMLLILIGKLFFRLHLGSIPLALLIIAVFAMAMSALSIFVGSMCAREDLIVGLAVLLSNVFAALGGCWWPIEIVPPVMRKAALVSPAFWAMDALHQIIFFHRGLRHVAVHIAALLGLTVLLAFLAGRFFRIRE